MEDVCTDKSHLTLPTSQQLSQNCHRHVTRISEMMALCLLLVYL